MRSILLYLLVSLVAVGPALAEKRPPGQPAAEDLRLRGRRARIERGSGLGLAALGVATIIIGGILVGVSGRASYDTGSRYQSWGSILIVSGIPFALAGGGLAVDGQNRLNDVSWRLKLLSGVFVQPSSAGVLAGVGLSF